MPQNDTQNDTKNDTIASLRAQLEAHDEDFERLVYALSHDLRQPLVGIMGFAAILQEDLQGLVDEEQVFFLQRILESARRMDQLLSGLLRLSRAGRTADVSGSVALDAVLDEAVSRLEKPVLESGAEIIRSPALPKKLRGSAVDLALLFFEILANALEFRKNGVPLQIEIGVVPAPGEAPPLSSGTVHLYVKDNGLGMESKYLDEVFQACRKLQPDSHDHLGIGLTICRKIVDRYGERIWIESNPGEGTTVHFTWTCTT